MKPVIQSVAEFFTQQGWPFAQPSDDPIVHLGFSGKNGCWQCLAIADQEDSQLLFLSALPCKVMPSRRAACAELLSRLNFLLAQGCFEMDFETGGIRFRTYLPVVGEPSPEAIEEVVLANLSTVDRYFAAIMQVVYAGVTPQAALQPALKAKPSPCRLELN